MADVRALLAAERSSRRLTHPHLNYTKSGLLQCTVCNLNIRSESLWEGHLKSANHKKNTQSALDAVPVSKKRKIEDDVEAVQWSQDTRKKSKSVRFEGVPEDFFDEGTNGDSQAEETGSPADVATAEGNAGPIEADLLARSLNGYTQLALPPDSHLVVLPPSQPRPSVNEDEWAAFERDLAPLTKSPLPQNSKANDANTSYTAAVISAPALSAAEVAAQNAHTPQSTRRDREAEAQDEKEESEARMRDEFAVMEEMEERIIRLREKREALRSEVTKSISEKDADPGQNEEGEVPRKVDKEHEKEHSSDEDEVDDWFS